MNRKTVVIVLLPARVDVLVLEGEQVAAARRLPIALNQGPEHWAADLRAATPAIRSCVDELGAAGASASVLYWSPTQAVDQLSLRVRFARDAMRAGLLAATESLGFAGSGAVARAAIVARDAAGPARQTHVVSASDCEDTASALVRAVQEAGLVFQAATPLEAAVIANIIPRCIACDDSPRAHLHIGETGSFFVVTHDGAIRFARRIGLGLHTLVTSLTRPVRASGGRSGVELSRDAAERVLHECGVPDPDRQIDWPEGLSAPQVMPLVQPVLERFVVELRQSLRFGVSEADRQGLEIVLSGPGGALPGLAELLSAELKHATRVDDASRGYRYAAPDSPGSDALLALEDRSIIAALSLMPVELVQRRRRTQVRRWLWTGAAAALAMIAIDWLRFDAKLREARLQASALAAESQGVEALRVTRDRLITAMEAMRSLEESIMREVGARPSARALMQEVAMLTPKSIRITDLSMRRQADGTLGTLRGYVLQDMSDDGPGLDEYARRVEDSPLFADVRLHNVQFVAVDRQPAQQFELSFLAVPGAMVDAASPLASGSRP